MEDGVEIEIGCTDLLRTPVRVREAILACKIIRTFCQDQRVCTVLRSAFETSHRARYKATYIVLTI